MSLLLLHPIFIFVWILSLIFYTIEIIIINSKNSKNDQYLKSLEIISMICLIIVIICSCLFIFSASYTDVFTNPRMMCGWVVLVFIGDLLVNVIKGKHILYSKILILCFNFFTYPLGQLLTISKIFQNENIPVVNDEKKDNENITVDENITVVDDEKKDNINQSLVPPHVVPILSNVTKNKSNEPVTIPQPIPITQQQTQLQTQLQADTQAQIIKITQAQASKVPKKQKNKNKDEKEDEKKEEEKDDVFDDDEDDDKEELLCVSKFRHDKLVARKLFNYIVDNTGTKVRDRVKDKIEKQISEKKPKAKNNKFDKYTIIIYDFPITLQRVSKIGNDHVHIYVNKTEFFKKFKKKKK